MGVFLNPGKEAFEEAVNSKIYVDKTEMVLYLNSIVKTKQKYACVSRPRRFGKTMAADMLCAYYGIGADSRGLFEKLKIANSEVPDETKGAPWDKYLGKFDVIRIVMNRFLNSRQSVYESLEKMQATVIREIKKTYPDIDLFDDKNLLEAIEGIYSETGRQCVVVIDEWDAVFRERADDKEGCREYLDFLRDLLKDNACVALAYMTGILPIKKYGKHSALNMFAEYSMMFPKELAAYTGFTDEEVRGLCDDYRMIYDEVSNWYDGYLVSDYIPVESRDEYRTGEYAGHKISLYCPLSVVDALTTGRIMNYWNKTETYEALAEFIRRDFD
ncbi:MAG: AAA family ATPase, partial [Lachnospiraceae bacterium]|nr:AAA family ATPase [Lachnospiraceae bacterium]